MTSSGGPAARGRHAPPPEVRSALQRQRLLRAAAQEFAARGYAGSSAESISRRAGMSKATFYEHFENKEDCMLALFDRAAEVIGSAMAEAARGARSGGRTDDPVHRQRRAVERMRAGTRAFLTAVAQNPEFAQTLLIESIAAGPEAARRRDQVVQGFAAVLDAENAEAARRGLLPRFASPHDPVAIMGAINELVSRQVRLGVPADVLELAPVIDRLISGLLASDEP
jgi:AcrR family transcriptional regulator